MDLFRFLRWKLRPEESTIEHVEHRPAKANLISIVDGVVTVREERRAPHPDASAEHKRPQRTSRS